MLGEIPKPKMGSFALGAEITYFLDGSKEARIWKIMFWAG